MTKILFVFFTLFMSSLSISQEIKISYEELGKTDAFVFGEKPGKEFEVLYFFSYSCPACYSSNDLINGWKKSNIDNSSNIEFRPIPVVFQDHWLFTSKAFFIANGLKIDIKDKIYDYFHKQKKFIVDDETLIQFFKSEFSIDKSKITPFLKSSALLKSASQAMLIADDFKIMGTPSFVIIDKDKNVYKVDKSLISSHLELISTLTFLVKPELRELLKGEKK